MERTAERNPTEDDGRHHDHRHRHRAAGGKRDNLHERSAEGVCFFISWIIPCGVLCLASD